MGNDFLKSARRTEFALRTGFFVTLTLLAFAAKDSVFVYLLRGWWPMALGLAFDLSIAGIAYFLWLEWRRWVHVASRMKEYRWVSVSFDSPWPDASSNGHHATAAREPERRDTVPTALNDDELTQPSVPGSVVLKGLDAGTYPLAYRSDCGCTKVIGSLTIEGDGSVQTATLELPPRPYSELPSPGDLQ